MSPIESGSTHVLRIDMTGVAEGPMATGENAPPKNKRKQQKTKEAEKKTLLHPEVLFRPTNDALELHFPLFYNCDSNCFTSPVEISRRFRWSTQ